MTIRKLQYTKNSKHKAVNHFVALIKFQSKVVNDGINKKIVIKVTIWSDKPIYEVQTKLLNHKLLK